MAAPAAASSNEVNEDYLSSALGEAAASLLAQRLVKPIIVPNPAVGTEILVKVPGGVIWEVLSLRFRLVTSAAVANRVVNVIYTDNDNTEYVRMPTHTNQAASATVDFNFWPGVATEVVTTPMVFAIPTPPIPMVAGYRIQTATAAIDVGDQYSAVRLLVREWSELDATQELVDMVEQFDSLTSRLVR